MVPPQGVQGTFAPGEWDVVLCSNGRIRTNVELFRSGNVRRPAMTSAAAASPVRLQGQLDVPLNRWLWLVKWLLVVPHLILLFFLWIAFGVLTFIAFFAILFTGRYPRVLFNYNVGVLRWSWRVSFYSSGAFATDEYPPFTLEDTNYPARLDVAYPEHLNRWLVLVKWLLAVAPTDRGAAC